MKWHIITDSSSDLQAFNLEENNIRYATVPFAFNIGSKTIIDEPDLDTKALLDEIYATKEKVGTACPSPYDWCAEMEEDGNYLLITISGALSGSYNSALLAKDMMLSKYPDRKIEVFNSCSAGPEIVLLVEEMCRLIAEDRTFEDVVTLSKKYLSESKITFALSSFDNLVKAGRVSMLVGKLAKILGLWGIGVATDEGTIKMAKKVRGEKQAIKAIIDTIRSRIAKPLSIVISHCHNLNFAEKLKAGIKDVWDFAKVKIMATRGLCSYYAEKNGVIVGFWGQHA